MKKILLLSLTLALASLALASLASEAKACTGITLQTTTNHPVTARTIEWAAKPLNLMYVIVPRGHQHKSFLPDNTTKGMRYSSKFGYVGIAVEDKNYVMEGINELGLAAGLFYFPDYGEYMPFDPNQKDVTISDMQFVSWVLASFSSIDELVEQLDGIRVVGVDPRASTVHWRVTEPSGRQIVIEIMNQHINIHENPLGVLTNSPSLDWHLSNLNNYINLKPGTISTHSLGEQKLSSFSGGTGMLGLPGDMSSPSRFVRAAFLQTTAPIYPDARQTVIHAFHLMNNFDIPIGLQFSDTTQIPDMHSATQVTIVTDIMNGRLYYRTMYDSKIRCIYLSDIDFDEVTCQYEPLDFIAQEAIEYIEGY